MNRRHFLGSLGAAACAFEASRSAAATEGEALVFAFFRNNGEDGLYLATSEDGLRWAPLNGDRPLVAPTVGESKLMRDPSIARGPDGTFHMVWTTSWEGKTIGHASSANLRNWGPQRALPVMADEPGVKNCWAPELFFDEAQGEFVVIWASTIEGRFPETSKMGEQGRNHRIYGIRTKDFQKIGATELFYNPGFLVIDAAIFRAQNRYAMVVKNETRFPPAKNLYLVYADSLRGPWTKPAEPFSGPEWAEGPSPIRIGEHWYVYFDKYRKNRYGVMRSADLQTWEDLTEQSTFPKDMRHGTVFRASREVLDGLR